MPYDLDLVWYDSSTTSTNTDEPANEGVTWISSPQVQSYIDSYRRFFGTIEDQVTQRERNDLGVVDVHDNKKE